MDNADDTIYRVTACYEVAWRWNDRTTECGYCGSWDCTDTHTETRNCTVIVPIEGDTPEDEIEAAAKEYLEALIRMDYTARRITSFRWQQFTAFSQADYKRDRAKLQAWETGQPLSGKSWTWEKQV